MDQEYVFQVESPGMTHSVAGIAFRRGGGSERMDAAEEIRRRIIWRLPRTLFSRSRNV